jgi:hypothetical protein
MEKFTLEILFHLIGIGSAGFYQGDSLFIVSDNSGFLYEYTIGTGTVNEYPLKKCDTKYSQARQA